MRRLLLLFVFLQSIALAQTPVNIQFGGLFCSAIRRASAQVQTYCYLYPPSPTWVLVDNRITTVPVGGVVVSFGRCKSANTADPPVCLVGETIVWQFALKNDGSIVYSLSYDGVEANKRTGTLP